MHAQLHATSADEPSAISTGRLPALSIVRALVDEAYARFRQVNEGALADDIPALAHASPESFGICVTGVDGSSCAVGDADREFSIQSIAKPFVFALLCQALGGAEARARVGVNGTGWPFNSIAAIELRADRTGNPMVNAGAIATTSLAPGETAEDKWRFIHEGLSRFAGRTLALDEEIYRCESDTNETNLCIARLLDRYGKMYFDPAAATDVYARQCALRITARDLGVMGATLADGGVNPVTGDRVINAGRCRRVLAVLATAGMYEESGDWLYEVGLPGKSGVSGGIVAVAPGKAAVATFSPPLDEAGNSVRGQLATRFLSGKLGLNVFASRETAWNVASGGMGGAEHGDSTAYRH